MKSLLISCVLLSITTLGFAQRSCGSTEYARRMNYNVFSNQDNLGQTSQTARDTFANEIITIPVVIHVLYNNSTQNISDAQVMSQLRVLNEDFRRLNADASQTPEAFKSSAADCRIMFCLAQVNPRGAAQKGIVRKFTNRTSFSVDDDMKFSAAGGDDAWDAKKYLNIWVCNMQSNSIGYATPPNSEAVRDGVVIQYDCFGTVGTVRYPFNKGRTATHEIAHWMGISHIWGDNSCGSDGIDDTPRQSNYNSNCPSFPKLSSCSPNANGDMFMNFMDYTNDACMNMFTNGQKQRMRNVFSGTGYRNSFLKSYACDSSLATAAPSVTEPVKQEKPLPSVVIYPNPVQEQMQLMPVNGYDLKGKTVSIYTPSGVLMSTRILNASTNKIDVSTLKQGIYVLKIGDNNDRQVLKLIKN